MIKKVATFCFASAMLFLGSCKEQNLDGPNGPNGGKEVYSSLTINVSSEGTRAERAPAVDSQAQGSENDRKIKNLKIYVFSNGYLEKMIDAPVTSSGDATSVQTKFQVVSGLKFIYVLANCSFSPLDADGSALTLPEGSKMSRTFFETKLLTALPDAVAKDGEMFMIGHVEANIVPNGGNSSDNPFQIENPVYISRVTSKAQVILGENSEEMTVREAVGVELWKDPTQTQTHDVSYRVAQNVKFMYACRHNLDPSPFGGAGAFSTPTEWTINGSTKIFGTYKHLVPAITKGYDLNGNVITEDDNTFYTRLDTYYTPSTTGDYNNVSKATHTDDNTHNSFVYFGENVNTAPTTGKVTYLSIRAKLKPTEWDNTQVAGAEVAEEADGSFYVLSQSGMVDGKKDGLLTFAQKAFTAANGTSGNKIVYFKTSRQAETYKTANNLTSYTVKKYNKGYAYYRVNLGDKLNGKSDIEKYAVQRNTYYRVRLLRLTNLGGSVPEDIVPENPAQKLEVDTYVQASVMVKNWNIVDQKEGLGQ